MQLLGLAAIVIGFFAFVFAVSYWWPISAALIIASFGLLAVADRIRDRQRYGTWR